MYYFQTIGVRIKRLLIHLAYPIYKSNYVFYHRSSSILEWLLDLPFYVMDVLALPEIYELTLNIFKWNTRRLNEKEIKLAKSIFSDTIEYKYIKIDMTARFGTKKLALAYVSFNTINYYKKLKSEIFIHELMHIWQYQNFGGIYIARAIKAQKSKEAYDYGGIENLYKSMFKKARLIDFNFEQQADIIEDFFKYKNNPKSTEMHLNIYRYFVEQLHIENNLIV